MSRKSKNLSLLAPVAIFSATWLVRKVAFGTRTKVDRKRTSINHKNREDTLWQIGIAVALAATELIVTELLTKENDDSKVTQPSVTESDAKG